MNQNYEIIFYEDSKGHCPIDDFLDTLLPKVRAKVMKWLQMLEKDEIEHSEKLRQDFLREYQGGEVL